MNTSNEQTQTASAQDDYDAKVLLSRRAFCAISKLCFERDVALDEEDWAVIDDIEARFCSPYLTYNEMRSKLAKLYLGLKRKSERQEVRA